MSQYPKNLVLTLDHPKCFIGVILFLFIVSHIISKSSVHIYGRIT